MHQKTLKEELPDTIEGLKIYISGIDSEIDIQEEIVNNLEQESVSYKTAQRKILTRLHYAFKKANEKLNKCV